MVTRCEDLDDPDDCTICLYIPYKKFNTLPVNEVRRIKSNATLEILKPGLYQLVSELLKVEKEELHVF
mgnify:CR=1 FL=1